MLLVPLHDPLRLAEDIALLDLVSAGRFSATCGLGYRESEYRCFGVSWERRGRVFDEKLDLLLQALKGSTVTSNGKSTQLNPVPESPVRSLIMVGGNSKAAARRAARFHLYFCPAIDDPELEEAYRMACREHGFKYGFTISPRAPSTTFISDNPAGCWESIGQYLLYDATAYGAWRHSPAVCRSISGGAACSCLKKRFNPIYEGTRLLWFCRMASFAFNAKRE